MSDDSTLRSGSTSSPQSRDDLGARSSVRRRPAARRIRRVAIVCGAGDDFLPDAARGRRFADGRGPVPPRVGGRGLDIGLSSLDTTRRNDRASKTSPSGSVSRFRPCTSGPAVASTTRCEAFESLAAGAQKNPGAEPGVKENAFESNCARNSDPILEGSDQFAGGGGFGGVAPRLPCHGSSGRPDRSGVPTVPARPDQPSVARRSRGRSDGLRRESPRPTRQHTPRGPETNFRRRTTGVHRQGSSTLPRHQSCRTVDSEMPLMVSQILARQSRRTRGKPGRKPSPGLW